MRSERAEDEREREWGSLRIGPVHGARQMNSDNQPQESFVVESDGIEATHSALDQDSA
jgi:hypothetical protein